MVLLLRHGERLKMKEVVQWQGYARKNGRPGIRNRVLVVYTVECASFVAKKIAGLADDPDTEVIGFSGCTDNEYAVRLLIALIRHPNVGAVLTVGLGCEYVQADRLAEIAVKEGKEAAWILIQKEGGTRRAIEKGLLLVRRMQEALKHTPRVAMGPADLVVGAECGGSDFTSGLAGNVVVGHFFDRLVDAGGTALFEEIVEAVGLKELLVSRAASEQAAEDIGDTYDKALAYCRAVRQYSVSPGNFAGGLTTIEEKSMGAVIKSGSRSIQGVLKVGCPAPAKGLWLLDSTPDPFWMQFGITNPNDSEGLTDLISCGCHIVILVTGRGNVVGSAVSPCIKVTGNSETYRAMEEDMDFNAGMVLEGEASQEEMAQRLFSLAVDIAGGARSKAEALGHREYFIPYKYQEKTVVRSCENGSERY